MGAPLGLLAVFERVSARCAETEEVVVFSPILGIRVRARTCQHILAGVGSSRGKKKKKNEEGETKKAGRSRVSSSHFRCLSQATSLKASSLRDVVVQFPVAPANCQCVRELMAQLTRRARRRRPAPVTHTQLDPSQRALGGSEEIDSPSTAPPMLWLSTPAGFTFFLSFSFNHGHEVATALRFESTFSVGRISHSVSFLTDNNKRRDGGEVGGRSFVRANRPGSTIRWFVP